MKTCSARSAHDYPMICTLVVSSTFRSDASYPTITLLEWDWDRILTVILTVKGFWGIEDVAVGVLAEKQTRDGGWIRRLESRSSR